MLGVRVLEQLGQLQRVLADLLHRRQQEAVQGNVDHLLQQPAGLKEVGVLAESGEPGELQASTGVVVAVVGVDLEVCLLGAQQVVRGCLSRGPVGTGREWGASLHHLHPFPTPSWISTNFAKSRLPGDTKHLQTAACADPVQVPQQTLGQTHSQNSVTRWW